MARRIQQVAILPRSIARAKLCADCKDQIGLGDTGVRGLRAERAEHSQRQTMGFREAALTRGGRRHRQSRRLRQ